MIKISEISKNALKFTYVDINGNEAKKNKYFLFKYLPILLSIIIVYLLRDSFNFDSKTIGILLSLFTGLLFGQLLKISDKVKEVPVNNEKLSQEKKNKRIQEINYLKLFFYFLTYSILISLGIITLIIIKSFIPSICETKLSNYTLTLDINFTSISLLVKNIFWYVYRFLIIFYIIRFIQYILMSINYLYVYIKFGFTKKENE